MDTCCFSALKGTPPLSGPPLSHFEAHATWSWSAWAKIMYLILEIPSLAASWREDMHVLSNVSLIDCLERIVFCRPTGRPPPAGEFLRRLGQAARAALPRVLHLQPGLILQADGQHQHPPLPTAGDTPPPRGGPVSRSLKELQCCFFCCIDCRICLPALSTPPEQYPISQSGNGISSSYSSSLSCSSNFYTIGKAQAWADEGNVDPPPPRPLERPRAPALPSLHTSPSLATPHC